MEGKFTLVSISPQNHFKLNYSTNKAESIQISKGSDYCSLD